MTRRASRVPASLGVGAMLAIAVTTLGAAPALSGRLPDQAATTGEALLQLVGQTFAVEPNGELHFDYVLTGIVDDPLELVEPVPTTTVPVETTPPEALDPNLPTTTVAPPPPPAPPVQITAEVRNYAPISDRSDVARLVGSDVDPDAFSAVSTVIDGVALDVRPFTTLGDDGTIAISLDIGTDVVDSIAERLKFEQPGIYPIRVQLLLGDPESNVVIATAGTMVERLAGGDEGVDVPPPIDLAVVSATPAPAPGAVPTVVSDATTSLDAAIDMAAALDPPAMLQVPPTLVAAEASTPEGSAGLAEALAGDELIAKPVVPLDVSSAVAAGRADTYTRLVRAGEELLISAVPDTPTRTDVSIVTEALSAGGAQHLRDMGVRFIVMPRELYRQTVSSDLPESDLFVDVELPDGGTLPLLLVDQLSEELTVAAADEILETSTTTEWAVTTLTDMLLAQADDDLISAGPPPRRSRILTTPDLLPPDTRLLNALRDLTETTPSASFTEASTLIGSTDVQQDDNGRPVTAQLPEVAGPSLLERIALIDATAQTMVSAASMLPADDPRPPEWANELDALISTGYSDAEVEAAVADLVAEADELTGAVQLPAPFTFTLTGRKGTIEIRIGNTADEPLGVVLRLESTKLSFPDGDQTVTLRPLDETSINVPVEARSNGTSSIELTVTTPAGQPIGDTVELTARVTALTGLGQVLTASFILVLLAWWFANWRGRRHTPEAGEVDDKVESETL